jgi:hypothetical protein
MSKSKITIKIRTSKSLNHNLNPIPNLTRLFPIYVFTPCDVVTPAVATCSVLCFRM